MITIQIKVTFTKWKFKFNSCQYNIRTSRARKRKFLEVLGDKVKIMINKNNEMEARADTAEKAVERLQDDVERLQEKLREMKTKNDKSEEEMESLFHDIRNLWQFLTIQCDKWILISREYVLCTKKICTPWITFFQSQQIINFIYLQIRLSLLLPYSLIFI